MVEQLKRRINDAYYGAFIVDGNWCYTWDGFGLYINVYYKMGGQVIAEPHCISAPYESNLRGEADAAGYYLLHTCTQKSYNALLLPKHKHVDAARMLTPIDLNPLEPDPSV